MLQIRFDRETRVKAAGLGEGPNERARLGTPVFPPPCIVVCLDQHAVGIDDEVTKLNFGGSSLENGIQVIN